MAIPRPADWRREATLQPARRRLLALTLPNGAWPHDGRSGPAALVLQILTPTPPKGDGLALGPLQRPAERLWARPHPVPPLRFLPSSPLPNLGIGRRL